MPDPAATTEAAGGSLPAGVVPPARRRGVVFAGGLAILALAFGVVWLQSAKYEPLVVGMEAPDFSLPDLEGKKRQLSDYRGKVVFLNFWATWCKPCKEEMPSMEALWENFKNEGFVMLAVSMDRVTTQKDIPPFIESLKLTFPILTDSWGQTDKRYKLMGVPETYLIDQNGILREKIIGPRDWTSRENMDVIVRLLHKQATSARAE
jgi:peroxiredoxin